MSEIPLRRLELVWRNYKDLMKRTTLSSLHQLKNRVTNIDFIVRDLQSHYRDSLENDCMLVNMLPFQTKVKHMMNFLLRIQNPNFISIRRYA